MESELLSALIHAANLLRSSRDFAKAKLIYAHILSMNDRLTAVHVGFADTLMEAREVGEAIKYYRRALALDESLISALKGLARGLRMSGNIREAVETYRRILRIDPELNAERLVLAKLLSRNHEFEEAVIEYREYLSRKNDDVEVLIELAQLLMVTGNLRHAESLLLKAIEFDPRSTSSFYELSRIRTFSSDDPVLAAMEGLATDGSTLSDHQLTSLYYGLAKVLDSLGRHKQAFGYLSAGARLKRRGSSYDEAAVLGRINNAKKEFDETAIAANSGKGHDSAAPVFIVGMPRSGSTLVEQIVSSHHRVFAAGEVSHFFDCRRRAGDLWTGPGSRLAREGILSWIGREYVSRLQAASTVSRPLRFTDKMLENFRFLGAIHLALPNARIIHVRRDPIDTCVSCFSQNFESSWGYSYDLKELGRYYNAYEELMDHWRNVIPASSLIEVQYEDLVEDLEGQARRLLDFCGLQWDDNCLSFFKNDRPVKTASLVQVRSPLYRHSVGKWRAYRDGIGPLMEVLGVPEAAV